MSPSRILATTHVYTAAVRYALNHSASLKFFSRHGDFGNVYDRDVFVYIGAESKRIGRMQRMQLTSTSCRGASYGKKRKGKKVNPPLMKTTPLVERGLQLGGTFAAYKDYLSI